MDDLRTNMTKGGGIGKRLEHRESACSPCRRNRAAADSRRVRFTSPACGGRDERSSLLGWGGGAAASRALRVERAPTRIASCDAIRPPPQAGEVTASQRHAVDHCKKKLTIMASRCTSGGGLLRACKSDSGLFWILIIMTAKSCGRPAHWLWTDSGVGCADSA